MKPKEQELHLTITDLLGRMRERWCRSITIKDNKLILLTPGYYHVEIDYDPEFEEIEIEVEK